MFISLLLRSSYDGFSSLLSISIAPDFNWLDLLSLLPEFFLWSWFVLCTSFWSLLIAWVRGGSRTAGTSRMEHFVIIVNGWKPLTIITKSFILDVAAVLDPSLSDSKCMYSHVGGTMFYQNYFSILTCTCSWVMPLFTFFFFHYFLFYKTPTLLSCIISWNSNLVC